MGNAGFFTNSTVRMIARTVHAGTNIPVSVVLAQMADETGYGTSHLWIACKNPSGMTTNGSTFWCFSSYSNAAAQYVRQYHNGFYSGVLNTAAKTQNATTVALALGQSPWAGGHYYANGQSGGALVAIINQYNLTKYDKSAPAKTPPASNKTSPTVIQQPAFLLAGAGLITVAAYYFYRNRESA